MMRDVVVVLLGGAIVAFVAARCECAQEPSLQQLPDVCIEKLDSTADLTQTDPNGGLPNGGKSHCGPVAVSNSLLWLADNGFGNLGPTLADRRRAQFEIARVLGSKDYMNTNVKTGTLRRKPTRTHCRKTPLMGKFRERVGLIHKLRQL